MALHDAAWKRLYSFTVMPRDLLAGFVPREWVGNLDLSTLEPWPGDLVSDGLRARHADRVWRVRRRDRRGFVLVTVEFQSRVDRTMPAPECLCRGAVRVLEYSTLLYQELLRNKELRRVARAESESKDRKGRRRRVKPEPLPPILPIVLHHGTARWWAGEDVAGVCAPSGKALAPYQPAQRYFLLDIGAYTEPLPEEPNLMAALIRVAHCRSAEPVEEMVKMLLARERALGEEGLLGAFLVWYEQVRRRHDLPKVDMSILDDLNKGKTMRNEVMTKEAERWAAQRFAERAAPLVERSRVEGLAEGRTEGRTEGQAAVICRLAARKFGRETAERLAERLAEVEDPERVVEVGEWLLECDNAEELLARVARLRDTSAADGDGAAQA